MRQTTLDACACSAAARAPVGDVSVMCCMSREPERVMDNCALAHRLAVAARGRIPFHVPICGGGEAVSVFVDDGSDGGGGARRARRRR